jgi:hypothetical protein
MNVGPREEADESAFAEDGASELDCARHDC